MWLSDRNAPAARCALMPCASGAALVLRRADEARTEAEVGAESVGEFVSGAGGSGRGSGEGRGVWGAVTVAFTMKAKRKGVKVKVTGRQSSTALALQVDEGRLWGSGWGSGVRAMRGPFGAEGQVLEKERHVIGARVS